MNDTVRAAVIGLCQSAFPVLLFLGVIDWSAEEIGVTMLFVTNAITLIALLAKQGQQASGTTNKVTASVTSTPTDAP